MRNKKGLFNLKITTLQLKSENLLPKLRNKPRASALTTFLFPFFLGGGGERESLHRHASRKEGQREKREKS